MCVCVCSLFRVCVCVCVIHQRWCMLTNTLTLRGDTLDVVFVEYCLLRHVCRSCAEYDIASSLM